MKLVCIAGARPQFIKAAVVSRAIADRNKNHGSEIEHVLVHTGQHHDRDMSDVFFDELGLAAPRHQLGVSGGSHGEMTGRMLERLEPVLQRESPDWVVVYGDTNSTLAGALAAAKLRQRVAHVEAGLRSHDRSMPEELNRIVADHVSDLLLAPTEVAVENLEREGISGARVVKVGDVMLDAALHYGRMARPTPAIEEWIRSRGSGFLLATVHRAHNTDRPERLAAILEALGTVAETRPVLLPLHPRTRQRLGTWQPPAALHVIEPVGYLDMIALLRACSGVLTDSGGLQKEAYFFGRPCLILREETEWTELVEAGHGRLVGVAPDVIVREAAAFLRGPVATTDALYGDGHAGERIVESLLAASGVGAEGRDPLSTRWRP